MLDGWTEGVSTLQGGLTTLREVAGSDVYPLFTLFSNPAVTAYMAPPPPTLAKFAGFVEWSHQQRAQGHGVCFGIVPNGMTTAVGILQVRLDPALSAAEWGFVLSAHFWSTGVFTDAANVVAECVFTTMRAQSARTRRRAKTWCAIRVDAGGVFAAGHSARSRDGVGAAGTRLAEPGARSSCVSARRGRSDPDSGRSGAKRVAAQRGA
jgi:hypothetical protein